MANILAPLIYIIAIIQTHSTKRRHFFVVYFYYVGFLPPLAFAFLGLILPAEAIAF